MAENADTRSPLEAIDAVTRIERLTTGERLTLVRLARRWPNVHPGLALLARETGSDKKNVGRWLDGLEAKGYVRGVYRTVNGDALPRRASGSRGTGIGGHKLRSTEYRLKLPGFPAPDLSDVPGAEPWPC